MKGACPKPLNGKPYYCKQCGAPYPAWLACDKPCELESKAEAMARAEEEHRRERKAA